MNRTKRLISLLFVGLASAALFAACGDETSCLEDGDCAVGEICVAEVCEVTCTSTADCAEGEACGGIDGDRTYCIADQSNNTNNNNSNNNTTETNNTTTEPDPVYVVMIRDTTTGAAGCEISDPGSDLASVGLEDLEGNVLGYFAAETFEPGEEPNGNDYPDLLSNLDGDAPSFGLTCPEDFAAENVASLGCGGYVLGRFLDGGAPVIVDSSTQITVVEYGPNCGGSADDTLEIVLCTDTASALNGDIASCTEVVGTGSGLVIADQL